MGRSSRPLLFENVQTVNLGQIIFISSGKNIRKIIFKNRILIFNDDIVHSIYYTRYEVYLSRILHELIAIRLYNAYI